MNIMLIAQEAAGLRTLHMLLKSGHTLVSVVTEGKGAIDALARKHDIKVVQANCLRDPCFLEEAETYSLDLMLNVHSLDILAQSLLEAPRIGCFNLHPGPLPTYAGLNTVSWALYRGETEYGVTLHEMVSRVDAGRIVGSASFGLTENDTAATVYAKCTRVGVPLISHFLTHAKKNPAEILFREQVLRSRRYFDGSIPHNGHVDWNLPAKQVHNLVRACNYGPFASPWGHLEADILGERIELVSTRLTHMSCSKDPGSIGARGENRVNVACSDEWLSITGVRYKGRPVAPSQIF